LIVSVVLQIACAVHVVRSGRQLYWIWILLLTRTWPYRYVLVAVIPTCARTARRQVTRKVPHVRRNASGTIKQRLEIADTVDNRRASPRNACAWATRECCRALPFGAQGGIRDRPCVPARSGPAQANSSDFAGARATLDTLFSTNRIPLGRRRPAHAHARALGENDAALERYQTLATSYPGEEARLATARCSGARPLPMRGVFREMLARKLAPRYRKKEDEWLSAAQRELASLGPG
jgi:hypothetical protein